MSRITKPLQIAGKNGLNMASGDGIIRRGHPILATFAGDYPEQILVTGVIGGRCPCCLVKKEELGENASFEFRDLAKVLDCLEAFEKLSTADWNQACKNVFIKPIPHPFWNGLPYTNIYRSISSDVLHQIYQEAIKHLLSWIQSAYPSAEIDARCRRLPPNHHIRLFMKGLSGLA